MQVTHQIYDEIAVVNFENAPVNALNIAKGFVAQIEQKIANLHDDPQIKAIILHGEGRFFSAGADISEFDSAPVEVIQGLQHLNQQLNKMQKLVVMALHGAALGGGLELALSAHARIAAAGTKLGLPEVNLGILPGAGATQALPRLVGIEYTWPIIMQGVAILPERALQIGLIDKISTEDLIDDAIRLTQDLLRQKNLPLKPCDRQIDKKQSELIDIFRQNLPAIEGAKMHSWQAILDCLQAAIDLPFKQGLAFEAEKFHKLLTTSASRALRYAFFNAKAATSLTAQQNEIITKRMMTALKQEAAKLIAEGVANKDSEIDAVMIKNLGLSAEFGGPLFWLKENIHDC